MSAALRVMVCRHRVEDVGVRTPSSTHFTVPIVIYTNASPRLSSGSPRVGPREFAARDGGSGDGGALCLEDILRLSQPEKKAAIAEEVPSDRGLGSGRCVAVMSN
ncbi:hypothetical protein NKH81_14300 [Mesorhizobium sp. M0959]|uniref:hypothetical protein n=1 Tax=Mesorhizobium sp. M0959 TaxID=2957034 RepID=UPI003337B808